MEPVNTSSTASLAEKRRQLEVLLAPLDSKGRLTLLVTQARERTPLAGEFRAPAFQIEGCLAKLWLVGEWREGRCWFATDSESLVVKAIAGLLCDYYSGQPPGEILAHDPAFLKELGITQHLTPNRRNGVAQVWDKIRAFAETHQAHS